MYNYFRIALKFYKMFPHLSVALSRTPTFDPTKHQDFNSVRHFSFLLIVLKYLENSSNHYSQFWNIGLSLKIDNYGKWFFFAYILVMCSSIYQDLKHFAMLPSICWCILPGQQQFRKSKLNCWYWCTFIVGVIEATSTYLKKHNSGIN